MCLNTRRTPSAARTISAAVLLLGALLLALSLYPAPAAFSSTTAKALRFTVIKRTPRDVIVKRHAVRVVIRRGSTVVRVGGVPRYRVVKRTRTYYLLRPLRSPAPSPTVAPADVAEAIATAKAGAVITLPAGTYTLDTISVPDGVTLQGAGAGLTWLKAPVQFGSNQTYRDLKIGVDGASAVHNRRGATNTTFDRCDFRGGGASGGWKGTAVVGLGFDGSCDHITFRDCQVECNVGVENARYSGSFNNVTLDENKSAHVSNIRFIGCVIGSANGVRTGSPRMGVECYTHRLSEDGSGRGWQNLTLRGCTVEACDLHGVDLSDAADGRASGVLIAGCLFKGAGARGALYGSDIDIECAAGVVIRDNHFRHAWQETIMFAHVHETGPGTIITGNTFDLDIDNGITPVSDYGPLLLTGYDNQFTDNTINCHYGSHAVLVLSDAHRTTVTGNTFNIGDRPSIDSINGASGNTVSPNTVN